MRRSPGPALAALGVVASALACRPSSGGFDTGRALAHIRHLASDVGPRPLGSAANARARDYLVDQLRRDGFTVRVQQAEGRNPRFGTTGRVSNVIAVRDGTRPEAIGLVAHYDSVEASPGAADDGIGVGVALESARVLAASARRWSVMVLLTDGEEAGLLGAAAAAADAEVRRRLRAYLNLEAMGPSRPGILFESGPGNAWMIDAWARSAPSPKGASYFEEIYRQLPNDTDFSELKRTGTPGLNMAAVGDIYVYHLPLDTAARIDPGVLDDLGGNVVAWADALEDRDITRRDAEQAVFFDLPGGIAISARAAAWRLIDRLACAVAVLGWLWLLAASWRREGGPAIGRSILWALLATIAAVAGSVGAVWLLRATREVNHPWYAHPWRTYTLILTAGLAAAWVAVRLGARLPTRWQPVRRPMLLWIPVLALWTAIAMAATAAIPLGAYLWTLPAGSAGLLVGLAAGTRRRLGLVTWAVACGVGVLWLSGARQMLAFVVPMSGMLPAVAPPPAMATLALVPALLIVPPVVIGLAASSLPRPPYLTRALVGIVVFAFAWAYRSDAYTTNRPERRYARFVVDIARQHAYWEIAGNEPGLGVAPGGPRGWRRPPADGSGPGEPLPWPYVFRVDARPASAPLRATRETASRPDGSLDVRIAIAADRDDVWASLVLPPDVTPLDSTYPGRQRNGRWTAVYGTVPREGMAFHLRLPAAAQGSLDGIRVVARCAVPGATAPGLGPPWLPEGRVTWAARAFYWVPALPV